MTPEIIDLDIIPTGNVSLIYVDIGKNEKIPINFLGDGFVRLFSILTLLATTENGIVLIDEIENGLHHSIITTIWEGIGKAVQEYNCQLIATTHSYECIKGAFLGLENLNYLQNFRFFRFDKEDDIIDAKVFNEKNLEVAFKYKMEIR
jgi:AAA15 family ATPase/GTPase